LLETRRVPSPLTTPSLEDHFLRKNFKPLSKP
jgi:hypothetical protein